MVFLFRCTEIGSMQGRPFLVFRTCYDLRRMHLQIVAALLMEVY